MHKILDDFKRQQIIAIMSIGGTRTLAAQYVGCHPQTITNTAKTDAKFAKDLNHAETSSEFRMLRTIADASSQVVHAAKWGLERIYPDGYRPRQPGTFSVEAVKQLLVELAARLANQAMSDDERRRILSTMAQFGKEMIVTTQPFVEQAIPLLAELAALSDDTPTPATPDTSLEHEAPEAVVSESLQEDSHDQ